MKLVQAMEDIDINSMSDDLLVGNEQHHITHLMQRCQEINVGIEQLNQTFELKRIIESSPALMDACSRQMYSIAIESIANYTYIDKQHVGLALEDIDDPNAKQICLEGLGKFIKKVYDSIIKVLKYIWDSITSIFKSKKVQCQKTEKQSKDLKDKVKATVAHNNKNNVVRDIVYIANEDIQKMFMFVEPEGDINPNYLYENCDKMLEKFKTVKVLVEQQQIFINGIDKSVKGFIKTDARERTKNTDQAYLGTVAFIEDTIEPYILNTYESAVKEDFTVRNLTETDYETDKCRVMKGFMYGSNIMFIKRNKFKFYTTCRVPHNLDVFKSSRTYPASSRLKYLEPNLLLQLADENNVFTEKFNSILKDIIVQLTKTNNTIETVIKNTNLLLTMSIEVGDDIKHNAESRELPESDGKDLLQFIKIIADVSKSTLGKMHLVVGLFEEYNSCQRRVIDINWKYQVES
jgi:hypothetical protein